MRSAWFLLPILFVVFACCVLGQFYFARQVRRILANKHPEVWRDLSSRAFFIDNAVFGFIWKKRHRALGDRELDQVAERMWRIQLVAFALWLAYAVAIFLAAGGS